jgi:predicted DCC family thiol-disulfide oxidoreductase YuxK
MIAIIDSASAEGAQASLNPGSNWEVEVFFDGECPLCKREIDMIRRRDVNHKILFTDITDETFAPRAIGKSIVELMSQIHGRLPNGELIVGPEVFRKLYSAIGFSRVVRLSRVAGISHMLEVGYRFFARYRLRLTGRQCVDRSCEIS